MWLSKLSSSLDLDSNYEQDWGICNSNAQRINDFLDFYYQNVVDHPYEPEALAELILQSANDAIETNVLVSDQKIRILNFLRNCSDDFPLTRDYWLKLDGPEFPIGELLREVLA